MRDKHYDHRELEKKWYGIWQERGLFHSEIDPQRKPYAMVIPPPNVTGMLHMGHVLNNSIQDILARSKRMMGYNVCWVPGTDHAGIATQNMVEKHLREQGIDPDGLSREDFLEQVWQWKEKFGGIIIKQLKKLGSSCDWDRERFTMDEGLSRAVLTTFVRLYEKGLIYRGKYTVNWCPALQTALSDDEVERTEEPSYLWHFAYPLADGSETMVVATTRPETMLGDTAVAVHPDDRRFAHLIGKKVKLPIVGRLIPVIADEDVAMDFGTGCVKVTPSHDATDFAIGTRHALEFITVMDKAAKMNENVPEEFQGLDRFACRRAVVEKMESLGLLVKTEPHTVAVGRCYRTKDVIEPYLSEQWFIKMKEFAARALVPVQNGTIVFHPERWVKTYEHWLSIIKDWCVSRQLKWGHRIPVWYCQDCGEVICRVDPPETCPACNSSNLEQDPDVLDTWASSWLWPFSVFGWPDADPDLDYYYPTATLVTAPDIIFFWVARMIMAGQEFMGDIPFSTVYFTGLVRDLEGRKMSKTLGNSPDPLDIIETYGADALRFSIVYQTPYGTDSRFAAESCELGRGFCTKIWNANRFLQMSFEGVSADPNWADRPQDFTGRWMLSRLTSTIGEMTDDLERFRFASAASRIYNFFWGEFCDWYVEFIKPLIKQGTPAEQEMLLGRTRFIIDACLRVLHPFMPFVTEELWSQLAPRRESECLMAQSWPEVTADWRDEQVEADMSVLQELVTGIRAVRKSHGLAGTARLILSIQCDARQQRLIEETGPIITDLVGLASIDFIDGEPEPGMVALALTGMNAYVDLRGHLDVAAEREKLTLKLDKLDKQIASVEKRLNNPKFVDRAPQEVVEKNRAELAEQLRQKETLLQAQAELDRMESK